MKFTKAIYVASEQFPHDEKYALLQQIRRAAVSIPSNIAEGQARHSSKEFLRFLSSARGSVAEVQTQLMLAQEFGYLRQETSKALFKQADEIYRLINGLYAAISEKVQSESEVFSKH